MAEKRETSYGDALKEVAHYWILNDKSLGICKKCGAQKQFLVDVSGSPNRNIVIGKTSHRLAA